MKDTNPDHYKVNGADFIKYMDDPQIKGFGDWMFANGYNVAKIECMHMTNQEYLSICQPEEAYALFEWLMHDYGRNYTDTRCAVIEWLKKEHVD